MKVLRYEFLPQFFNQREITHLSDSCNGDDKRRNTGTTQVHQSTLWIRKNKLQSDVNKSGFIVSHITLYQIETKTIPISFQDTHYLIRSSNASMVGSKQFQLVFQ